MDMEDDELVFRPEQSADGSSEDDSIVELENGEEPQALETMLP